MKRLLAAFALFAVFGGALAQNAGTVSNHAFAIGKGPGVTGYTSLLCGSGQIAIGSATDPVCRTISGDGAISAAGVLSLANVNANVGSFGSTTQCVAFTVNAKGLITAASAATCTPVVPIGSVTGLGTGIASALTLNVNSAGAPILFNGNAGTPSAIVLTNATNIPAAQLTGLTLAANEPAHTGDMTNTAGSLATSVLKTGGVNFGTYATATQGQLPGVTSNTAASAGNIGEIVSATLSGASPISLTSGVAANVTSIPLTAGEWDVSISAFFSTAATTNVTYLYASSSSTSLTLSSVPGQYNQALFGYVPGAGVATVNSNPYRFSLAAPGTAYLVAQSAFTVSTLTVFGYIRATRVH